MAPWSQMVPSGLYDPDRPIPFPALSRSASSSHANTASAAGNTTLAQKFLQGGGGKLMLPSAAEGQKGKIQLYSGEFYAACTVGGILSCGLTHTAVTPLDVVKCNSQVSESEFCVSYIFICGSLLCLSNSKRDYLLQRSLTCQQCIAVPPD